MEKLPMCRICLVQNVRMYIVVNMDLHELYEKLTDIPFVTEDSRPIIACFVCYTKLKKCGQFLRKCLKAEEQFAQINEDYKPDPLINHDPIELCSGFIKPPTEHISIVDECQTKSITIKEEMPETKSITIKEEIPETKSITIKEELPAVCEGLDEIIEPKGECQNDGWTWTVDAWTLADRGGPSRRDGGRGGRADARYEWPGPRTIDELDFYA